MYSYYCFNNCILCTEIFNVSCIYNILETHRPIATAITPEMMLAMVYIEKWNSSLALSNECFSKAKVEKVVSPPQNPVANNKI